MPAYYLKINIVTVTTYIIRRGALNNLYSFVKSLLHLSLPLENERLLYIFPSSFEIVYHESLAVLDELIWTKFYIRQKQILQLK